MSWSPWQEAQVPVHSGSPLRSPSGRARSLLGRRPKELVHLALAEPLPAQVHIIDHDFFEFFDEARLQQET